MGEQDSDSNHYYEADPDTGKIKARYTDTDFLDAIDTLASDDYLPSTGDVADELGCNSETARLRLKDLAEDGRVRKLDSKSGFHWLPVTNPDETE